ncbi:MAG: hypothetical protein C0476_00195 [Sphingomonas sp.]|nr:hypothetical protein [Sphingomonas sp.]
MRDWDEALAHAASLPGVVIAPFYGRPAAKVAATGRAFLSQGREADSFCIHIDRDMIDMLKATDAATYHQTPHYEGWDTVLVRYGSADPARVIAMIERAYAYAAARPKVRARSPR